MTNKRLEDMRDRYRKPGTDNPQMLRVLAGRRVCPEERELDEMKDEENRPSHDDLYEGNRRLHLSSNYSFSHPRIEFYQSTEEEYKQEFSRRLSLIQSHLMI
jgi:hypothetical protein